MDQRITRRFFLVVRFWRREEKRKKKPGSLDRVYKRVSTVIFRGLQRDPVAPTIILHPFNKATDRQRSFILGGKKKTELSTTQRYIYEDTTFKHQFHRIILLTKFSP